MFCPALISAQLLSQFKTKHSWSWSLICFSFKIIIFVVKTKHRSSWPLTFWLIWKLSRSHLLLYLLIYLFIHWIYLFQQLKYNSKLKRILLQESENGKGSSVFGLIKLRAIPMEKIYLQPWTGLGCKLIYIVNYHKQ